MTFQPARLIRSIASALGLDQLQWERLVDGTFGGADTQAGVRADPREALRYAVVYAITKNLATDLAKLPLNLNRRGPDGRSHSPAIGHPLYRTLRVQPNPAMSPLGFRRALWFKVFWYGNAYCHVRRDSVGRVLQLDLLDSSRMRVTGSAERSEVQYEYTDAEGKTHYWTNSRVFHVAALGSDGVMGVSPIQQVSESVGSYMAVERFAAKYFANGGRPLILLKHPAGFRTDEEESLFYRKWRSAMGGSNAHGVGVLQKGLEYVEQFKPTNEEAQMLQTRRWHKEDLAQVFRVPPHLLQDLSRGTFSNIVHQDLEYAKYGLLDWLVLLEQEIGRQLLQGDEQDSLYARHNLDSLLRADIEARFRSYATGRQWGILSVNECREKEELNPIAGGDAYLRPSNMIEVDASGMPTPGQALTPAAGAAAPSGDNEEAGERARLEEIEQRLARVEEIANADALPGR